MLFRQWLSASNSEARPVNQRIADLSVSMQRSDVHRLANF